MDMIGQPDKHCSLSLFCGYSDKKNTPYLWVLSCLYLILFKNRPIVPDATLDQVDPLVLLQKPGPPKKSLVGPPDVNYSLEICLPREWMPTLFLFFNEYVNELWTLFKVGTVCFQNLN